MRDLLLLVPARANSKGLPGKNLATVAGVSLVGRAVLAARAFVRVAGLDARARVFVDTDGPAIADEGRRWGADVPFLRPPELATDSTQTVDNVLHAWERLGREPEWLILLQPTSPLRRAEHIAACWEAAQRHKAPSAISVLDAGHPLALAMYGGDGEPLTFALGTAPASTRRQDHPVAAWPNGAVYVTRLDELARGRAFIVAGVTVGVRMAAASSVDVDTAHDLQAARLAAWSGEGGGSGAAPASAGPIRHADTRAWSAHVGAAALDLRGRDLDTAIAHYLSALGPGTPVRAVLCGGEGAGDDAADVAFSLRSVFGAPVCWDATGATPAATRRALLLGVAAVSGTVPAEWIAESESVRRLGA